MADETITIKVEDDSPDDSGRSEGTRSYDLGGSREALERLAEQLGSDPIDTSSISADEVQETIDALNGLESSSRNTSDAVDDLTSASKQLDDAVEATDKSLHDLEGATDELLKIYDEQSEAIKDQSEDYKKLGNNVANAFRQITNMGRAAGVVSVRVNQMAQAGAVMTRSLSGANLKLALFGAGIAATILAIRAFNNQAESLIKEIGGFSTDVVEASVERQIQAMEGRMRLGREVGAQSGDFIEATNEMSVELREFKREALKILLPILTLITKVITLLTGFFNEVLKVLNLILTPVTAILEAISSFFSWFIGKDDKPGKEADLLQPTLSFFDPDSINLHEEDRYFFESRLDNAAFELLDPPNSSLSDETLEDLRGLRRRLGE